MIVLPLTTTRRDLSIHIEVDADEETGLDLTSYVQCELIRSINRRRLVDRLGTVGSDVSDVVDLVVRTLLDH